MEGILTDLICFPYGLDNWIRRKAWLWGELGIVHVLRNVLVFKALDPVFTTRLSRCYLMTDLDSIRVSCGTDRCWLHTHPAIVPIYSSTRNKDACFQLRSRAAWYSDVSVTTMAISVIQNYIVTR
jgi:hypothetical protein